MYRVEVLIDRPTRQLDKPYSYSVPPTWGTVDLVGKRILVTFNRVPTEAFVIAQQQVTVDEGWAEIKEVLDDEAVFNVELLELAQWMAQFYVSSVTKNLKLMIPAILKKQKNKKLIRLKEEIPPDAQTNVKQLFNRMQKQEVTWQEALALVDEVDLNKLLNEKYLALVGDYVIKQVFGRENWTYVPVLNLLTDAELDKLFRRAPKQYTIVKQLMQETISYEKLREMFPLSSIKSLEKKGFIKVIEKPFVPTKPVYSLTDAQNDITDKINIAMQKRIYHKMLLWGVTGSGKTEIYMQAAENCLRSGKSVIILLPEIALAHQMVTVFQQRFSDMAIIHSDMSAGEKYAEWLEIKQADFSLVLGARSAIFAPVNNLGLIIIDEEQEPSYKQEQTPKYHALEVAQKRAEYNKALLLVGSATPSSESFSRVLSDDFYLLKLEERVAGKLPHIIVEDMKQAPAHKSPFTPGVIENIKICLQQQEQVIMFINRRGYAPRIACYQCGQFIVCPQCSVGMVFHKDKNICLCHYCNMEADLAKGCPACGNAELNVFGWGTQKLEQEAIRLFPKARIARLDIDTGRTRRYRKKLIQAMRNGEIDILIGTQMVAKGLDFPQVGLVIIAETDALLSLPDYRAGERAFQLLTQAAGRAGRREGKGQAIIQTFDPQNRIIQKVVEHDYFGFITEEIKFRKRLNYPPFSEILRLVISSSKEQNVKKDIEFLAEFVREVLEDRLEDWSLLGPAPCPILRIKNNFRYNIIIKSDNRLLLQSLVEHISKIWQTKRSKMEFEFNPLVNT